MSRLWYGADPLAFSLAGAWGAELQICKVIEFTHHPVWDGPTYLWTKFRIHIHAIFNPEATSWIPGGLWVGGDPTVLPHPTVHGQRPSQGVVGGITDIALRHFLMQPRRQLIYGVEPNVPVLFSPEILFGPGVNAPGLPPLVPCDANNGPFPIHCNVTAVKGTKTFLVDFCIETCLNECVYYQTPTLLSVVVSHRWSMEHQVDEDLYTTRIIRGHAHFKTDLLNVVQAHPDAYRAFLVHPVPDTFKRDQVRVSINEDNNTLDYTIIDREQCMNIGPDAAVAGVTRIEAWFNNSIVDNETGFDLIHNVDAFGIHIGAFINPFWNMGPQAVKWLKMMAGSFGFPGAQAAIGNAADWMAAHVNPLALATAKAFFNIPRQVAQMTVRVWGHRLSSRADLFYVALQIALAKIHLDDIVAGTSSLSVTEDLMGTFVELRANYRSAPDQKLFAADPQKGFAAIVPAEPDDIPPWFTFEPNDFENQPPVGGRGSYIEMAVANALQFPCPCPVVQPSPPEETAGDQTIEQKIQFPTDVGDFKEIKTLSDQITLSNTEGLP